MKLHIVVVRDIKANCYGQPQFVPSLGGAIRSFGDECQRKEPGNVLGAHPEDFELYDLGWFGDGDCHFELYDSPKQLAVGGNYKQ